MSDTARTLTKALKKRIWRTSAVAALIAAVFAQPAGAVIRVPIYDQNGNLYANLKVLEVGEDHLIPDAFQDDEEPIRLRPMNEYDYKGLVLGFDYMTDLLGPAVYAPTIYVTLDSTQNDNAAASSYAQIEEDNGVFTNVGTALFGCVTGVTDHGDKPHTFILINLPSVDTAWRYQQIDILPRTGMLADLPGTVLHELFHAYGLATLVSKTEDGDYQFESVKGYFTPYTQHLYDAFGNQAQAKQKIHVIKPDENDEFDVTESDRVNDRFNVLYRDADSGVSFRGDKVKEVIGANTVIYFSDMTIVEGDGLVVGTIDNSVKDGIPINGFEYINRDDYETHLELSHIELQNSLMSHQGYRNWQTLMEAEMALLQDIGYKFDRKRYFGTSLYASGEEDFRVTQPFGQRQNYQWVDGVASTQSLAIGTHIYGSLNNVTVQANQLADGMASIGVRVDGVKNNINIADNIKISANGTRGLGVAFAYGRNHTLTVGSGAQIEANGLGGTALSFDFGSNEMSDYTEYRGSYMRFERDKIGWYSLDPEYYDIDAISSALMDSVVINGTISATGLGGRAIYIAPNALVSRIELTDSAVVNGDIVSDWNAKAVVSKDGKYYLTSHKLYPEVGAMIPFDKNNPIDLTTELVLGNITFEGNVIGADGIRLTVGNTSNVQTLAVAESGATKLTGLVQVLGVNVNTGATLTGGATYVLTPEKADGAKVIVGDNTEFQQQTFVNNGKLISSPATGTSYIDGNYTQSEAATLVVGVDSEGNLNGLAVSGTAELKEGTNIGLIPSIDYFPSGTTVSAKNTQGSPIIGQEIEGAFNYAFDVESFRGLSSTLAFNVTGDSLSVTRNKNAYSQSMDVGSPDWQQKIARILDTNADTVTDGDAQNLVARLDFSTGTGIADTIADLGGDAHMMAVRSHFALERLVDRTLSFATQNPAPEGKSVWVQPFGGKVSERFDEGSNDTDIAGIAGGVTLPTATGTIGWQAVAAYMKTDDSTGGETQSEGLWLAASVKDYPYNNGAWFIEGAARLGVANTETERKVLAQTLKTDGVMFSLSGTAKVGADIDFSAFELSPFAGFAFTTLRMPSDTESGTGALDVDSQWYTSVRGQLGVKASTDYLTSQVAGYAWKWDFYAMYEREFTDDMGSFTAGLKGMNGTFTRDVTVNDQNRYLAGVSLGLFNESGFAASLRLDTEMTHGYGSAVTGSVQLRWKF